MGMNKTERMNPNKSITFSFDFDMLRVIREVTECARVNQMRAFSNNFADCAHSINMIGAIVFSHFCLIIAGG